jgi:hypothetical protein
MAKPAPGEKDLALWAVEQVRQFGGVLEHPKQSTLWSAAGLPKPGCGRDAFGGWTLGIEQFSFGHRAAKPTLLYIVGCDPMQIPNMPIVLGDAPAVCGTSGRRKSLKRKTTRPEVTKAEREHTPPALAAWLVELAARCKQPNAMLTGAPASGAAKVRQRR